MRLSILLPGILCAALSAVPALAHSRADLDDAAVRQADLKRRFESFRNKLTLLAARLEGGSEKDREKARALRTALKLADERGTDGKFDVLIRSLRGQEAATNADVLAQILKDNEDLRNDLRQLIALLSGEDQDAELRARREAAVKFLEQLKDLRSRQARVEALTEMGKSSPAELRRSQEKLTAGTGAMLGKAGEKSEESARTLVRRQLEEAQRRQQQAESELGRENRNGAAENQGVAVARFDEAVRRLEDHVAQLRREEMERVLASLLRRCERMLAAQVEIRDGTLNLDRQITAAPERKASLPHSHQANLLADQQERNLREADATRKVLESEGSAVAFAEVFEQVRLDMRTVKERLARTDTGKVTQTVENDLIDTLQDMIRALQRSRQNLNGGPVPPGPRGTPGPSRKPSLLDMLSELKMVRTLQARVNHRTELYGSQYRSEQLPEAGAAESAEERERREVLRRELRDLAGRQHKIGQAARNLVRWAEVSD
jgi:hypothetical protein